jgi:hypothetical protein
MSLFVDGSLLQQENDNINLHVFNENRLNFQSSYLQQFSWDGSNVGNTIELKDNDLLSLDVDDEIRGVVTMCYGNCDNNGNCYEYQLYTHDTLWFDTTCFNGGVIRPINVYTNYNTVAFNTIETGYDNNYYGARKFGNLIPGAPYKITITAQTGRGGILDVPKEITEWEYGTNEDVSYSGVKITPTEDMRSPFDNFGYDIQIHEDLMIVGVPNYNLVENGYTCENAGSLFIYKRDPEPSGYDWSDQPDKSSWVFQQQLNLPYGFQRDYRVEFSRTIFDENGSPIRDIPQYQYYVGQDGRQLGHSFDISDKVDDKQIIVAGGPGGRFTRNFNPLVQQPAKIVLFVFTDEFLPTFPYPRPVIRMPRGWRWAKSPKDIADWLDVHRAVRDKDILFNFFCDPPVEFDVTIIICEGVLGDTYLDPSPDFSEDRDPDFEEPDFIFKRQITRQRGSLSYEDKLDVDNQIFEELKDIYHEFFPLQDNTLNSGVPVIAGFYVDNSVSYGTRALGSIEDDKIVSGGLDLFINWFKEFAYNNGLTDTDDLPAYPGITVKVSNDETWIKQATSILNAALNFDTLRESRTLNLFANNLGTFNDTLSLSNLPPPSGGSVYVFEGAGDDWELIQEIKSPTQTSDTYIDRFGHDVAISDDGSIIVIGSPYINESVQIYEQNPYYKDGFEDSFAKWIDDNGNPSVDTNFGDLYQARRQLINLVSQSSGRQAFLESVNTVFNDLSPSGKFAFRQYYNENQPLYTLVKTVSSLEIKPEHSWDWFIDRFIPTPRLGYSVDANEDGSLVAIGSPTDSLGAQDEGIMWYQPGFGDKDYNWASHVNAGAVRILESRQYYPTNSVMQYGIFGNLHRTISNATDQDLYFNHFNIAFENYSFVNYFESEFTDPEIPQGVATLFIITPEVDALSEEVVDNIKNWLALGDRNLVLVGNDPVWEANGAYANSNAIINELLQRLDSRMRLHPARNEYESMVNVDTGLYYNNIPSYVPQKTTYSNVYRTKLRSSGVADIRLYDPGRYYNYDCSKPQADILSGLGTGLRKKSYVEINNRCNMPIVHEGDLRAEWKDQCETESGGFLDYYVNLAYIYGTHTVCDWGCYCDQNAPPAKTANYEPVPVLAAAEFKPERVLVPGQPRITEWVNEATQEIEGLSYNDSAVNNQVEFIWSADSGNYTYLNTNDDDTVSNSLFFDPAEYNNKDALLQAKAEVLNPLTESDAIIQDIIPIATEEKYENTSSSIVFITSVVMENQASLFSGNDQNIKFYMNLTDKTPTGGSSVGQLGGWTNRTSFKDGYSQSYMRSVLLNLGNNVEENVNSMNINLPGNNYDILWIANTDQVPSAQDLNEIKTWLNKGNKKLIITIGDTGESVKINSFPYLDNRNNTELQAKVRASESLLALLGVTMKPLFVDIENKYADIHHNTVQPYQDSETLERIKHANPEALLVNQSLYISKGLRGSSSVVQDISILNNNQYDTVLIEPNESDVLLYPRGKVKSNGYKPNDIPYMRTGYAKVKFAVDEASSYKIFFTTVSESIQESRFLGIFISDVNINVDYDLEKIRLAKLMAYSFPEGQNESISKYVYANERIGFSKSQNRRNDIDDYDSWPITNFNGSPETYDVNVTVPSGVHEISIYITADFLGKEEIPNPESLRTQRLVGISGVKVPVIPKLVTTYNLVEKEISPEIPPRYEEQLVERQISSDSSRYCPTDYCLDLWSQNPAPIADGPVTVAQELYHQAPFRYGYSKSRITLISDASLIQGSTIASEDNDNVINDELFYFLSSLVPSEGIMYEDFYDYGLTREYDFFDKIVSPEKTSPAKLLSSANTGGLNNLFGNYPTSILDVNRFNNHENLIDFRNFSQPMEPIISLSPTYLTGRRPPPKYTIEQKLLARESVIDQFKSSLETFGVYPKFRTTINNKIYEDPNYGEGVPELMKDYGYDYLSFEQMSHVISGYPGDLFGYKVKIHKNQVYVGSPFSVFKGSDITSWDDVILNHSNNSPIYNSEIGYNGGAGSVYIFDKNNQGVGVNNEAKTWSCVTKIRPDSLGVAQNGSDGGDQFGRSIDVAGDVLAIGAPGHIGDSLLIEGSGQFIRKEFNPQFKIPHVSTYDLSDPNLDPNIRSSGTVIKNQGAVFAYENKISDWSSKRQEWIFTQKLIPQGENSRSENLTENDFFGASVAIDRHPRKDSDYALAAGSFQHSYSASGNIFKDKSGSVYCYDAMLRRLPPSFAHPETNIAGRIFGDRSSVQENEMFINFDFVNGNKTDHRLYQNGVIFADNNGEIFVEVSGKDVNPRGYSVHRPFIKSIVGTYINGKFFDDSSSLYVKGGPLSASGGMNLFSPDVPDNVYNILGMTSYGVLDSVPGEWMNLHMGAAVPVSNMSTPESGVSMFVECANLLNNNVNIFSNAKLDE